MKIGTEIYFFPVKNKKVPENYSGTFDLKYKF
jgi:hypothetical protein